MADGVLFAFVAPLPAAAEFFRWTSNFCLLKVLNWDDMTALGTVVGTVTRSILQFSVRVAFSALILQAADPCRGSGSSQMIGTLVGSDSSNMFFMAINTSLDLPGQ